MNSSAISFTGVSLPFSITDMLTTATSFLGIYGQWVLLALAVIFTPVLYGLTMKLVKSAKKAAGNA